MLNMKMFSGLSVNSDEKLLAGSCELGDTLADANSGPRFTVDLPGSGLIPSTKRYDWYARMSAKFPMAIFTISIETGEIRTVFESTDIINHVQFSPTESDLLMYCHDGPWHLVDRIWTIRTDGTQVASVHRRTIPMEVAGHEFFGPDGKFIWFDLQTPKSEVFWLAGHNIASREEIRFHISRENWSVHYAASPDGNMFAGDGGGPDSVAERNGDGSPLNTPIDGRWIFLYSRTGGDLKVERLVDLGRHNYQLEPNVTFTPDGKWVVFQSNMRGGVQVTAVQLRA